MEVEFSLPLKSIDKRVDGGAGSFEMLGHGRD